MKDEEIISAFKEIMGVSPTVKIIECFLEWGSMDMTITEIARYSTTGRNTTYEIIETLEKKGVLKVTRKIGRSKFYILNRDNDISQGLISLFSIILKEVVKNEF